jgi:ABC-type multidrug transport system ATPase subunit
MTIIEVEHVAKHYGERTAFADVSFTVERGEIFGILGLNPTIAILDELTTGLDPAARRDTWDLIEAIRDRGTTILLVTHFMPEAERLCDRLAVIDAGRVIGIDTPAGIVAGIDSGQRMRFRPSSRPRPRPATTRPSGPGTSIRPGTSPAPA